MGDNMIEDIETELLYPLAINQYGDIAITSVYETQVRQAIMSCLHTIKGERVYRELYGLQPTLFTSNRLVTHIRAVKEALYTLDLEYPEVPYTVTGYMTDGVTVVSVSYAVNGVTQIEQLEVAI